MQSTLKNKITDILTQFLAYIENIAPNRLKKRRFINNELEIQTTRKNSYYLAYFFAKSTMSQFEQLTDIAVIDTPGKKLRFSIAYILFSCRYNTRLILTTKTDEVTALLSVTSIYNSANWLEREV